MTACTVGQLLMKHWIPDKVVGYIFEVNFWRLNCSTLEMPNSRPLWFISAACDNIRPWLSRRSNSKFPVPVAVRC